MDVIKILEMEEKNRDCIYLHREGVAWYVYEHSAFYFNSAVQTGRIESVVDSGGVSLVRMLIGEKLDGFFSGSDMKVCEDGVIEVKCKVRCRGFNIWRSHLIL